MRLSFAGLELLKKSEGFRDCIYADVAGFRTIGFGHRLLSGEEFPNGINHEQGEAILRRDIAIAEAAVERLVKVSLSQGQFDALVDFVFNLGSRRLASSTLLKYLNSGKYAEAAWQITRLGPLRMEGDCQSEGPQGSRIPAVERQFCHPCICRLRERLPVSHFLRGLCRQLQW